MMDRDFHLAVGEPLHQSPLELGVEHGPQPHHPSRGGVGRIGRFGVVVLEPEIAPALAGVGVPEPGRVGEGLALGTQHLGVDGPRQNVGDERLADWIIAVPHAGILGQGSLLV